MPQKSYQKKKIFARKKFLKKYVSCKENNKTDTVSNEKRKNYQFIKRSKNAEKNQRQQQITRDKYYKTFDIEKAFESDVEQEGNTFGDLLLNLKNKHGSEALEFSFDTSENSSNQKKDYLNEVEDIHHRYSNQIESANIEPNIDDFKELDIDAEPLRISEDEPDEDFEVDINKSSETILHLDSYSKHFDNDLSPALLENLFLKSPVLQRNVIHWPSLGKLIAEIPVTKNMHFTENNNSEIKERNLAEKQIYAPPGQLPKYIDYNKMDFKKLFIKESITKNISAVATNLKEIGNVNKKLTPLQWEILTIASNYQDIFYSSRTIENAEELRTVYCLHILNHLLKVRSKILHHNTKLALKCDKSFHVLPDTFRDQSFARPKILIMVPFRDSAFKVVNTLISLYFGNDKNQKDIYHNVVNYKRFFDEYTGDTIRFPKTNPKPEDYEKLFSGNTDDNFRVGLSFTKKCIKLYSDFYSSDILIASPLGLRMIIGALGDTERDYDFLTSIEVMVLDQAEIFFAQNWDHVLHIFDHLHLQPQFLRNTNFSRIRSWCLNGWSNFYRQTIIFTSHELPEFRSLFNNKCSNYHGKVRTSNQIEIGTIRHIFIQIPQIFHKIYVTTIDTSFDTRFHYFIKEILPKFKNPSMTHCMIYVPSYFDFVRLRNYFKAEAINFVQICEYSKDGKIARARDMFFHSAAHFLLYSERGHFFKRTRVKGIRHLIFYQPPFWPTLYPEMINLMQNSYQNTRDGLETSMSVTVLYTKYDIFSLSSILGTENANKLVGLNKTIHKFVTES